MLPFYPHYEKQRTLFWFLWIFAILYIIGIGIYLVFIMNLSSRYTYFANPASPGNHLSSSRYTFQDIGVRMTVIGHLMIIAFIFNMILYRESFGCTIMWIVLWGLALLCILVGILALSISYGYCNKDFQVGNLCNSYFWCCVLEIYTNSNNQCPNVLPCALPLSLNQLDPNPDFLGLFWTNIVLVFFQIVFLIVMAIFWTKKTNQEEEQEEITIVEPPQKQLIIEKEIKPQSVQKLTHALVTKRKK